MGEANPEHMTVVSLKCVGSTGREGKKNLWHFKCQGMGVKAKLCLVSLMLPAAETLKVRRAPELSVCPVVASTQRDIWGCTYWTVYSSYCASL